jgi:hypothetical protein
MRFVVFPKPAKKVRSTVFISGNFRAAYLTTSSTCPINNTSSANQNTSRGPAKLPRPYDDIPGPKIYPIVGSLIDFMQNGGTVFETSRLYYKKYGPIAKQNIGVNEVIIYDPQEHLKGKNISWY